MAYDGQENRKKQKTTENMKEQKNRRDEKNGI